VSDYYFHDPEGDYEKLFHLGGIDTAAVGESSPVDIEGRVLPQFGPAFVPYVHDEFAKIRDHLAQLGRLLPPHDRIWGEIGTTKLDGSGNGTVEFEVAPGFELFVHRLFINDGVSTFGAATTGGYLELQNSKQTVDGTSLATVGLPAVYTVSSSAAICVPGGNQFTVKATGLTANRSLTVVVGGRLIRSFRAGDEP
jgi:hypothetical protein